MGGTGTSGPRPAHPKPAVRAVRAVAAGQLGQHRRRQYIGRKRRQLRWRRRWAGGQRSSTGTKYAGTGASGLIVITYTAADITPVVEADVFYTGKTVNVLETEVTPVAKATITFTGQTVTIAADVTPPSGGTDMSGSPHPGPD